MVTNEISPDTLTWVESAVGDDVERSQRLVGGMSSEVHRCWCRNGSSYVVRHITDRDWLRREPELIIQERAALDLLADSELPTPRHVASDAGAGCLLMTYLPGSMRADRDRIRGGAEALGKLAASIAAVELPTDHGLNGWRSWVPDDLQAPVWGDRVLWDDGITAFLARQPPRVEQPVLLHRDLHPLNILWKDGEIVGVVDWVNACVGHPHAELGHCRWNLSTLVGPESADAFLSAYLDARGEQRYDPWWDICTVMGILPGPVGTTAWAAVGRADLTAKSVVTSMERFLRTAIARL